MTYERKKRISIHFAEINLYQDIEVLEFMQRIEKGKYLVDWVGDWIGSQISNLIDWNSDEEIKSYNKKLEGYINAQSGSKINALKFLEFFHINIQYVEMVQQDLKKIIKDLYDTDMEQKSHKREHGFAPIRMSMSYESQKILLDKINELKYHYTYARDQKIKWKPVISLEIKNFEQLIYKDFMDHLNEQQEFILCKYCGEIIADPSKIQVSNYYQGKGALHSFCREDHKRKQARIRKQKSRGHKK